MWELEQFFRTKILRNCWILCMLLLIHSRTYAEEFGLPFINTHYQILGVHLPSVYRVKRVPAPPLNDSTARPPDLNKSNTFINHTPTTTPQQPLTTTDRFNIVENHYKYYSYHVDHDIIHFNTLWKDLGKLKDATRHDTLSQSYRVAAVVKLNFKFHFYGHAVTNVTIATGGFLYMSPYLHRHLTATQYIAPLMANFDASQHRDSHVYYHSEDTLFRVEWRNMYLKDQPNLGNFTFQVILFNDNSISFLYKNLPVSLTRISSIGHPVTVGLSDAYYVNIDKSLTRLGNMRPTIFEYHRVKVNLSDIQNQLAVRFRLHRTCNMEDSCSKCLKNRISKTFDCRWCEDTDKCSDGFDWSRHEWLVNGCHRSAVRTTCPVKPPETTSTVRPVTCKTVSKSVTNGAFVGNQKGFPAWGVALLVLLLLAGVAGGLGGVLYYGYTHPTTPLGLWLIQHRPSEMKRKLTALKFWDCGVSRQDRYGMESTA